MGIENIDALKNDDSVAKKSDAELEDDFANPKDAAPVPAHIVDEDPEEHIGDECADPWSTDEEKEAE